MSFGSRNGFQQLNFPGRLFFSFAREIPFLGIALLGLVFIAVSVAAEPPWSEGFAIAASALLTISLSLPIALYFQLKQTGNDLRILDKCHTAGKKSVFLSRDVDSSLFRNAIDNAADKSDYVRLLGVAFRNIFSTNQGFSAKMTAILDNPEVVMRILILNPDSDAAKRRNKIEESDNCIGDIEYTLKVGFPAVFAERLKKIAITNIDLLNELAAAENEEEADRLVGKVISLCNVQLKTYDNDPIMFLMDFHSSIFVEQYHFGKPENIRRGACIGKKIPIFEYASESVSAGFMRAHFDLQWGLGCDETKKIAKNEIEKYVKRGDYEKSAYIAA